jgi:hypothetical protein
MSDLIGRRGELEAVDRFVERAREGLASFLVPSIRRVDRRAGTRARS